MRAVNSNMTRSLTLRHFARKVRSQRTVVRNISPTQPSVPHSILFQFTVDDTASLQTAPNDHDKPRQSTEMPFWNGDPRAVVPPAHLESSRDVITPSREDCAASPYPLGMGVYGIPGPFSYKPKRALRLLYVSPFVARDRSPANDYRNAAGVRAGWYVVGEPDTAFEVRVTKVNERAVGDETENGYVSTVAVDGLPTRQFNFFTVVTPTGICWQGCNELVYQGFVEECVGEVTGSYQRSFRKFSFQKKGGDVEGGGGKGSGTIGLTVYIGVVAARGKGDVMQSGEYELKGDKVSEKSVAKEGKSLGVRRDGGVLKESNFLPPLTVVRRRHLPDADVKVFVREESWLRSRRLIDDEGGPCSYEMFQVLLEKDNKNVVKGNVERPVKKAKTEKRNVCIINVDEEERGFKKGEVIDLT